MAFKIWKIALLVEDPKAAEDFYVNKLGMPVIERLDISRLGIDDDVLFLDAGSVQLELIPKAAFADARERLATPGVHHISFGVDDVEKTQEELKENGLDVFVEAFSPTDGITYAFFDGLNGVNLQLFERK